LVSSIIKGYGNFFNKEDEEDDEEGEEWREKEDDAGSNNEFGKKWGWISMVDRVSETIREPWGVVFDMGVMEFFNILCYAKDKAVYNKKQIDDYVKKH
jgi:hypothetical protein